MGLYLLNISVDTADLSPNYLPEDLSFNDQESIIEIILEKVLGFEDAIKEYDDPDREDHNTKKNMKIDFLVYASNEEDLSNNFYTIHKKTFPEFEVALTKGFKEIVGPPPKF